MSISAKWVIQKADGRVGRCTGPAKWLNWGTNKPVDTVEHEEYADADPDVVGTRPTEDRHTQRHPDSSAGEEWQEPAPSQGMAKLPD